MWRNLFVVIMVNIHNMFGPPLTESILRVKSGDDMFVYIDHQHK